MVLISKQIFCLQQYGRCRSKRGKNRMQFISSDLLGSICLMFSSISWPLSVSFGFISSPLSVSFGPQFDSLPFYHSKDVTDWMTLPDLKSKSKTIGIVLGTNGRPLTLFTSIVSLILQLEHRSMILGVGVGAGVQKQL